MTADALEATVHELLAEVLYDRDLTALAPDASLAERGLLDSLAILKLVTATEERLGVRIPDRALLPENFESVRALARLLGTLVAG